MNRAEIRRKKREEQKNKKTYVMTADELEKIRKYERQMAKAEIMQKTGDLAEQILKMMIVIPTNVLINDYWPGSAKKRIPKFVEDCLSLYHSWECGAVDMQEMQNLTEEYAKIKLIEDGTATARVINGGKGR